VELALELELDVVLGRRI